MSVYKPPFGEGKPQRYTFKNYRLELITMKIIIVRINIAMQTEFIKAGPHCHYQSRTISTNGGEIAQLDDRS
jgi:hypothetical protein